MHRLLRGGTRRGEGGGEGRRTEVENHVEPARPGRLAACGGAHGALVARLAAKEAEDVAVVERLVDAHLAHELLGLGGGGRVHGGGAACCCCCCAWRDAQGDDLDGGELVGRGVEGAVDGRLAARGEVLAGDEAQEWRERGNGDHLVPVSRGGGGKEDEQLATFNERRRARRLARSLAVQAQLGVCKLSDSNAQTRALLSARSWPVPSSLGRAARDRGELALLYLDERVLCDRLLCSTLLYAREAPLTGQREVRGRAVAKLVVAPLVCDSLLHRSPSTMSELREATRVDFLTAAFGKEVASQFDQNLDDGPSPLKLSSSTSRSHS